MAIKTTKVYSADRTSFGEVAIMERVVPAIMMLPGQRILTARLMGIYEGSQWPVVEAIQVGMMQHIGTVTFVQETIFLHCTVQEVTRIEVRLFSEIKREPHYPAAEALLTYLEHRGGLRVQWEDYPTSAAYWVLAANPTGGNYLFLLVDIDWSEEDSAS